MNIELLNTEIQEFINTNINSNITDLVLKGSPFPNIKIAEIVEQIEAKKRCKYKLPTWYSTKNIYFPNKLNIEQTSSEITAKYKASLIKGKNLIDLTGGFGIDSFYFSKRLENITHCELNTSLSQIVNYNYKHLKVKNIKCIANDGIETLKHLNQNFDWIYIDPSRRDNTKNKVFLLNDCVPDIPKYLELIFKHSKNVMIKTSPLLDITSGINELRFVKAIHIVAVNNEVKELLWILKKGFTEEIEIKTLNITKEKEIRFDFYINEESQAQALLSEPLTYLYEPNASILKAGAFNIIAEKLNLNKLHKHSHLYTSKRLMDFPGRSFKIINIIPYNKKRFKQELKIKKANITTRNFPETVKQIRKKLSLKDGGDDYLFFTRDINNDRVIIITKKTKK